MSRSEVPKQIVTSFCVLFIMGTVHVYNELAEELVLICFPNAQAVLALACYHP